jgi:hypothetical protein
VTETQHEATLSDEVAAWAALQCQALARDAFTCLACGGWGEGAFPRVQPPPAGPLATGAVTDLVTLCHSCRDLSAARDPRLHYRGMWLLPAEDPAEQPVYAAVGASYDVRWLLPDGTATRDPRLTAA